MTYVMCFGNSQSILLDFDFPREMIIIHISNYVVEMSTLHLRRLCEPGGMSNFLRERPHVQTARAEHTGQGASLA